MQNKFSTSILFKNFNNIMIFFNSKKIFFILYLEIKDSQFYMIKFIKKNVNLCDTPNLEGSLTTRQPVEDSWMSGNPTPHY